MNVWLKQQQQNRIPYVIAVCNEKVIYNAIYVPSCWIGVLSVHLSHSHFNFPRTTPNLFISVIVIFEHTFN